MRRRHKLALKYFLGAVGCFLIGYGASWASGILDGSSTAPKKNKPKVVVTVSPQGEPLAKNDKERPSAKPGASHTVKSGETLSTIADANGTTFEALAQYNDIPYPYNLTVGQVITIPAK